MLLSGEPGIGKSRLVRALRERLAAEPHTPLAQFCSPYHANTALHPVIGLLERAAGLRREDPPAAQLDRLEAMLALAVDDVREAAPVLADLLGIPAGDRYPPLDLSPQQKKERTFRALLDQLAGLAAKGPVLALYEDVHWADPTTLELIGRVIEAAQRLPVLAVVTYRPEFAPPWGGHGHVTTLSLGRLGRRQGGAMVERVTGGKALPAEVLEQILARTDGVPLFVEELTKTVLESGLLRDAGDRYELAGPLPPLAIPATLAGLADGAARPAGAGQGDGADGRRASGASSPTTSWRPSPACGDDELRDALGAAGRGGADLPPRRSRRRRATPSSTRWCGTRPTRACLRAGGSSCTARIAARAWKSASPNGGDATRAARPALRRGRPSVNTVHIGTWLGHAGARS